MFFRGGENFLERKVFSPAPPFSKNFQTGSYIFVSHSAFDDWAHYVRTYPRMKVLVKLFQKLAQSRARSPCRTPQSAKSPLSFIKRRRGWIPLLAKEEGEPSSGVLLCLLVVFFVGKVNFFKKVFLSPHPYLSRTLKRREDFLFFIVRWLVVSQNFIQRVILSGAKRSRSLRSWGTRTEQTKVRKHRRDLEWSFAVFFR